MYFRMKIYGIICSQIGYRFTLNRNDYIGAMYAKSKTSNKVDLLLFIKKSGYKYFCANLKNGSFFSIEEPLPEMKNT